MTARVDARSRHAPSEAASRLAQQCLRFKRGERDRRCNGESRRWDCSRRRSTNLHRLCRQPGHPWRSCEVNRRFAQVLESALEPQRLCSGDPVCADHDPATAAEDRTLHGAACYGCLVIAETSCDGRPNAVLGAVRLVAHDRFRFRIRSAVESSALCAHQRWRRAV